MKSSDYSLWKTIKELKRPINLRKRQLVLQIMLREYCHKIKTKEFDEIKNRVNTRKMPGFDRLCGKILHMLPKSDS